METKNLPVARLNLDPKNPRLPESISGSSQSQILKHLLEVEALEELAQSMVESGYFVHDPLIVLDQEGGLELVVIEGNRRLATLKLLIGAEVASGLKLQSTLELTPQQKLSLESVPCYLVTSRAAVASYIGFRHVGGLKLWPPEAKARYVWSEVTRLVKEGSTEPFREFGRRIGSNAQGVRGDFIALGILKAAQDEASIRTGSLQSDRFGVWKRALSSANIRTYIGLRDSQSHADVLGALKEINFRNLRQVVSDLSPIREGKPALIRDSRQLDDYGRILCNSVALGILRKSESFDAARQVVAGGTFSDRIIRINTSLEGMLSELSHLSEAVVLPPELKTLSDTLASLAKSVFIQVRGILDEKSDSV